jgi:hypothetical protein
MWQYKPAHRSWNLQAPTHCFWQVFSATMISPMGGHVRTHAVRAEIDYYFAKDVVRVARLFLSYGATTFDGGHYQGSAVSW